MEGTERREVGSVLWKMFVLPEIIPFAKTNKQNKPALGHMHVWE